MKKINIELSEDELLYIIEALGNTSVYKVKKSIDKYVNENTRDYVGLKEPFKKLLSKMNNGFMKESNIYRDMISKYKENFK